MILLKYIIFEMVSKYIQAHNTVRYQNITVGIPAINQDVITRLPCNAVALQSETNRSETDFPDMATSTGSIN